MTRFQLPQVKVMRFLALLFSHWKWRTQLVFDQPWSVGLSIQDEAMDATRCASQGAHYYVDAAIFQAATKDRNAGKRMQNGTD